MARVEATPEEIRRFAHNLHKFDIDLSSMSFQLQAQFRELGDTWRDQEFSGYAQEFEQAMRAIDRFLNESERQVPFLLRKAQRLEDYLQQR
jgi:uncharacterized protein YukE